MLHELFSQLGVPRGIKRVLAFFKIVRFDPSSSICTFAYVLFCSELSSCVLKNVCLIIIQILNISTQRSVKKFSFIIAVQNAPRQ